MGLSVSELGDLINTTLANMGPPEISHIQQELSHYPMWGSFIKSDRVLITGGDEIERRLVVDGNQNFREVDLYESDSENASDVVEVVRYPWKHWDTHWIMDRREGLMNRGKAEIVDEIKVRRQNCMLSIPERFETRIWELPAAASKAIFGVPYFVVKNATTGFTGAAPTGYASGTGGLVHDKWRNWSSLYTENDFGWESDTGLFYVMAQAALDTNFVSPIDTDSFRNGPGRTYRWYTGRDNILGMKRAYRRQNDDLGGDLGVKDGMVLYNGNPVIHAPGLDSDTSDPVYGINHRVLNFGVLRGNWMFESSDKANGSHNVFKHYIDGSCNMYCTNRRALSVVYHA